METPLWGVRELRSRDPKGLAQGGVASQTQEGLLVEPVCPASQASEVKAVVKALPHMRVPEHFPQSGTRPRKQVPEMTVAIVVPGAPKQCCFRNLMFGRAL